MNKKDILYSYSKLAINIISVILIRFNYFDSDELIDFEDKVPSELVDIGYKGYIKYMKTIEEYFNK